MTHRTPNIFVVGAGPVAAALAGALRLAGAPVLGLWSRRPEAARKASASSGVAAFSAAPPDLLLEADIVICAVRDDAIAQVAEMLVKTGLVGGRHVMLHCSGAHAAAEVLAGVAPKLRGVGTLHPLRSIVDARAVAASMKGTVFGVEGDDEGRATALELVQLLGGRPIDLSGSSMALYHAAASLAANALVALADAATEVLAAAGVSREQGLAALTPLMQGTLDNLARVGLPQALTGPIARGDAGTVRRHLHALSERAPGVVEIYKVVARRTAEVAKEKGDAPAEALARVSELLSP